MSVEGERCVCVESEGVVCVCVGSEGAVCVCVVYLVSLPLHHGQPRRPAVKHTI